MAAIFGGTEGGKERAAETGTAPSASVTDKATFSVICVVGANTDWDEPERKALTREQLAAFFSALPGEWIPFLQTLVHQTGVRISEAIGLTWADLDLDASIPTLTVRRQIYRGHVGPPKTRYESGQSRCREAPPRNSVSSAERRTSLNAER